MNQRTINHLAELLNQAISQEVERQVEGLDIEDEITSTIKGMDLIDESSVADEVVRHNCFETAIEDAVTAALKDKDDQIEVLMQRLQKVEQQLNPPTIKQLVKAWWASKTSKLPRLSVSVERKAE